MASRFYESECTTLKHQKTNIVIVVDTFHIGSGQCRRKIE